jgi:hypothetical protein
VVQNGLGRPVVETGGYELFIGALLLGGMVHAKFQTYIISETHDITV